MNIDIRALSAQIDEVDDRIADLFDTRMTLCAQIAVHKNQQGMELFDEPREREIVQRLVARAQGPVASYLPLLYETILDLSRDYQAYVLED